ncbi:MAG: AI-2E family transporter [Salinibacterium sp.]|nr:AI-2E family transporter [Salinibacterium sp.]
MKIQQSFRLGLFGGLGVLVAVAIGATIGSLATVLTYVGAALFLALGLDPIVTWLENRKVARPVAIMIVLAGVFALIAGLVLAIIPIIVEQVARAIDAVPRLITALEDDSLRISIENALPWLEVQPVLDALQTWVNSVDFSTIGGGVLNVGIGIATGVTGATIVFILTIYFVASLANLKRGVYRLVPASKRESFIGLAEQISTAVGRYVIGQGSLAAINGLASFVYLTLFLPLIGVPVSYSVLLAFIAFLGSTIPLVGTISGSIVISLIVLLFDGSPSVIWVAAYYLVYMQIEAYVLSPRVMAKAVKIPGAVVVIAAVAGGTLLGILGALVAIPVAAAILLVINQILIPRQNEL